MFRKTILLSLLVCLVLSYTPAQQPGEISFKDESKMPEGRIGERISALIETVNSDDPATIKSFLEGAFTERFLKIASLEEHVQVFREIFQQWGGVDFHSIRTYVPERAGQTVVILKDRNFKAWRAFVVRWDVDDDYRIAGLNFNDARTPSNVEEPALTEQELVREVESMMKTLRARDVFSGTVLIAKGDKVLYTFACGEASKRFHVPIDIETKFNLGSMNKMFTSLAVMRLVEQGKLSLDSTLDLFLDETWLPKDITGKITIHHLLSHTSGLGSYFNRTYDRSSRQLFRKLDDYKPLVKDEKLSFEPGARYRYSNTGMFLLGVVIESVTGGDYFEHIRENIYRPAGMTNSDCYEMDYPVENLAIGYSPDAGSPWKWQNNLYKHVIKGGPAGGGFSTVKDLHRFALALVSGKFVSRASLDKMWTDQSGSGYGYGFGIQEGPAGKVVGHSGGFSGINSNLDVYLDSGYIVAAMSNYDQGAGAVSSRIATLLSRVGPR
jgi:CubicO group peptidase (beta-lactamase class C family)